ncbi:MAG: hypothetical protein PVH38_05810 [Gammaproteobacteria bacterium]|jgi:hypothetical protein
MPYYIYIVSSNETGHNKSAEYISEFDNFKHAKTEVRRLRTETPLEASQAYKVMFAEDRAEAEQRLTEYREQPIAREWEK